MSTKCSQLFLPQLGNRSSLNPSCFKEKQWPEWDFPGAKVAGIPKSPIRASAKNPKTAAVPVPDNPDIERTGCLSLQIRVGVFVGDSLADVPESGEAPGENWRFSSRAPLPPSGAWSVLFGTARQNEFARRKILLKKANAPVYEHPKAPLADQGWCSAQRIKIEMIASGNHTIICAAPVRTLGLRGSELSSFRALSIKRGFTIPQSRACVRRASQLPLRKGAVGCSRTSALFRTVPAQENRVPKNRDAAEICATQAISP